MEQKYEKLQKMQHSNLLLELLIHGSKEEELKYRQKVLAFGKEIYNQREKT